MQQELDARADFVRLIGSSPKMQRVYRLMERVSRCDSPVLIQGETGTGKELVARSIHARGVRKHKTFVPVDCTGLVPSLVESELFGYVKGAFTGAQQNKRGVIESASGGTLFLDEIGELPIAMQSKLLRVLQEKQFRPVGGTTTVEVDLRIIAATNRNLQEEVDRGRFRRDLFYRINVLAITLPPLRDRLGDIPSMIDHFLQRNRDAEKSAPMFSEEAMNLLIAYDWPGNVRELENAVARALALNSGPILSVADLPTNVRSPHVTCVVPDQLPSLATPISSVQEPLPLAEMERQATLRALEKSNGSIRAAAHLLGIGRTTLYRKLNLYKGDIAAAKQRRE